jgi:ABC-type glycerol-3-phosphate transport system permease component
VALVTVLGVFLFPILWMVVGVFKLNVEHHAKPPVLIPSEPLRALTTAISFVLRDAALPITKLLFNSIVVTLGTLAVTLSLGILAAYGFARFRVGGQAVPFLILAFRMIPTVALGVPIYVLYQWLGLLDTHVGLILAYASVMLPITIWLLRTFFEGADVTLEEAAVIDGANRWQVLWYVTLPLTAPGIVSVALLAFMAAWNEFFLSVLLTRSGATTLPAILPLFLPRELAPGAPISAAFLLALATAVPVVLLALFLQRYLIAGLTLGGVKE